jgi:hypothetical protein
MDKPRYAVEVKNLRVRSILADYTKQCVVVVDRERGVDVAEYLNLPTSIALWRAGKIADRLNKYS